VHVIAAAWAKAYIDRGGKLLRDGKEEEARAQFDLALQRDPDGAKVIDAARAKAYVGRGTKLLRDGKEEEAKAQFDLALQRESSAVHAIAAAWAKAYIDRGSKLLGDGKEEEARAQFDLALQRDSSAVHAIAVAWAKAYIDRGGKLLGDGKEEEARAQFDLALQRDPDGAKAIDAAWVKAYVGRGTKLVEGGRDDDAKAQFDLALQRDPTAAHAIVFALATSGEGKLRESRSDPSQKEAKQKVALALLDHAVILARRDGVGHLVLAEALFGRGRAHDARQDYKLAIEDFREAQRLGQKNASNWLWWSTNRLADQISQKGNPVEGLLIAWSNLLNTAPDVRITISSEALKLPRWAYTIGLIAGDLKGNHNGAITECDRLASFQFDPNRVAAGVAPGSIDASRAIPACDEAIKSHPEETRYLYQRARAHSRAARQAADAKDDAGAKAYYASAFRDLEAAMAKGYPMAFNNMAIALKQGESVEKDESRAADLGVETLNRVLQCCWAPVARQVLGEAGKQDTNVVRQVVGELTRWAAALGNQAARELLTELTITGTLAPSAPLPPAKVTDVPPWFR
jgi:tetratricopeptide (TPR) repeat protein